MSSSPTRPELAQGKTDELEPHLRQIHFAAHVPVVQFEEDLPSVCAAEIVMCIDKVDFTKEQLVECARYGVQKSIGNARTCARAFAGRALGGPAFIAQLEAIDCAYGDTCPKLHKEADEMLANVAKVAQAMKSGDKLVVHFTPLKAFVHMKLVE